MTNPNVNKVERDKTAAALIALEEVDVDAANLLRTMIRAYCLFDVDLLEVREMLLRAASGSHHLGNLAQELAMKVERVARDYEV